MKRFMYIPMLCIVAALVIVSCCRCGSKSRNNASLTNKWQLVKLMGQDVTTEGDSFTLTFTDEGRISGKGSCNRLMGDYIAGADGKLEIGQLGSTRMLCPNEGNENLYFATVGNADAYEIDGQTLMLLCEGEAQAVFTLVTAQEE